MINPLRRFGRSWRDVGLRDAVTMRLARTDFLQMQLRAVAYPRLVDLARESQDAAGAARELVARHFPDADIAALEEEHAVLSDELKARYADADLTHPRDFAVEPQMSLLEYLLVRLCRPRVVVETGVANGHSTLFLLHACARSGGGAVHSIDVSEDVGGLLTDEERSVWRLHVLRQGARKASFTRVMRSLAPIDLFIHDSNHTYAWQSFEYRLALEHLADGGLLASDDVDASFAFVDACHRLTRRPSLLVGTQKVFGFVQVG